MLRVFPSTSSAGAKAYFASELTKGDYYFGEHEIAGQWYGKAAAMLGLSGEASQEAFNQLVDNINPMTGAQLTPRNRDNRRHGYDLTFNAPKALSVLYEYSKDERLVEAFRDSVHSTMEEIEKVMQVRVRKGGENEDRTTGNLLYAAFEHYTARPVEGHAPDPNLHCHCYCINATFDDVESEWKAGQFGDIKRDAPYYEALFHSNLTARLSELGLQVEKDGKFWTFSGIEKATLEKYSNRTAEIEAKAAEQNITNAKAKDRLGAQLRNAKVEGLRREQLRDIWWQRLEPEEREQLDRLSGFNPDDGGGNQSEKELAARRYVTYALEHHLERQSVVPLTRLKETALREGFGEVELKDIDAALDAREGFMALPLKGRMMASTREVLLEEAGIIRFTREGYGTTERFNQHYTIPMVQDYREDKSFALSEEQQAAVTDLLTARHRVMAVEGKAGVGKTTMMASLIAGIEEGGTAVTVLAPTADAAYDTLRDDGERYHSLAMQEASTLARFFNDEKAQLQGKGNALLVDEAGLMSVGDMHALFTIAERQNNRVILVGDTSQHNSVMRGDAYRILQDEAGLETYQLETIRRQKGEYRKAVSLIAKGKLEAGFNRLDKLGFINEELDSEARYRALGERFAGYVEQQETVLTVAPTHAEGKKATDAIREELKQRGHLKGEEHTVTRLHNRQLTVAERGNVQSFEAGQVVRFQQNARGGIKRGEQFTVSRIDDNQVFIADDHGNERALDLAQAKRFNLYEKRDIAIAAGERLRITEGGKSKDGKRINNGAIYSVKRVERNGDIVLDNGRVLDGSQGNFNHGYVTTSHASQGKTVKHVLVAQSSDYSGASSSEQFYVSVSRGKKSVEVFTDDKTYLKTQIQQSSERISATQLTKNQPEIRRAEREELLQRTLKYMARVGPFQAWNPYSRPPDVQPPEAANDTNWLQRILNREDRGRER